MAKKKNSARQMFRDAGFATFKAWWMGGIPLTSRLNLVHILPHLFRFPVFDWLWTSSYEIQAVHLEG